MAEPTLGRYSGGRAEIWARYGRDTGEMYGDTGETWGDGRASAKNELVDDLVRLRLRGRGRVKLRLRVRGRVRVGGRVGLELGLDELVDDQPLRRVRCLLRGVP